MWYYVGTGQGPKKAKDMGLTNKEVKLSAADDWVEFGANNEYDKIKRYET